MNGLVNGALDVDASASDRFCCATAAVWRTAGRRVACRATAVERREGTDIVMADDEMCSMDADASMARLNDGFEDLFP